MNVTADQPPSENSSAQWQGEGCGVRGGCRQIIGRFLVDLPQVVFLSDEVGQRSDEVARRRLVSPAWIRI